MSMILDALTRAEHERQIEKQPKLKFVNPVKQQKKPARNIWLWVAVALGINALVLAVILQSNSNNEATSVIAGNDNIDVAPSIETQTEQQDGQAMQPSTNEISTDEYDLEPAASLQAQQQQQAPVLDDSLQQEFQAQEIETQAVESDVDVSLADARPLALESNDNNSIEPLDRPLIYEAKQAQKTKLQQKKQTAAIENKPNNVGKEGAVSFSNIPLTSDDSAPAVAQAPKLLIDQGQDENVTPASSSAPSLKDLPLSSRNALSQYEVNVHVFDDDPQRRFVLINMDKYKEGQSITDNGPLVEEITREGVIVDYGDGRALLPPK